MGESPSIRVFIICILILNISGVLFSNITGKITENSTGSVFC